LGCVREVVEDENVGMVPLLELAGVPCMFVFPCEVLEVVEEEGVVVVPLLELIGVS
jgi:hypothetical protein